MTKSKFALQLFLSFSLLVLTHVLLNSFMEMISWPALLKIDAFVFLLTVFGYFVMASEMGKAREQFVSKFLIITTVQMLAVMSMLLFISYTGKGNARIVLLNQVSFFVAVMAVQSVLLIRSRK
jgi:hypothetical protein